MLVACFLESGGQTVHEGADSTSPSFIVLIDTDDEVETADRDDDESSQVEEEIATHFIIIDMAVDAGAVDLECISLGWRYAQGTIASLSIILLLLVVLLFATSKAMRVHPAPLICLISISECICLYHALVWSLDPAFFVSWWHIDWLFVNTTFRSMDTDLFRTNQELCRSNQRIYLFFQLLTLSLNTFFFIDILYTLRRPFEPGRKRMWWYMLISLVLSCIGVIVDSSSAVYCKLNSLTLYRCVRPHRRQLR